MESTLLCIFVGHHQIFSIFSLASSPQRCFQFRFFRLSINIVFVFPVIFSITVESLCAKICWNLVCGDPSIIFTHGFPLQSYRIYFLNNSEEFIFQQFWTLLVSINHIVMFFDIIFVFLHTFIKQIFEIFPQNKFIIIFLLYSHPHKINSLLF